jgi:hypothetical protein
MDVTSLRLAPGTLQKVQALAGIETLRQGRRITASELMRGVIQRLLEANAEALARSHPSNGPR